MTTERDLPFSLDDALIEALRRDATSSQTEPDVGTDGTTLERLRRQLQQRLKTLRVQAEDAERRAIALQSDASEVFDVRRECRKIADDEREDLRTLRESARVASLERYSVIRRIDQGLAGSVEGMAAQVAARADLWLVAEAETVAPVEAWSQTLTADRDRLRHRVAELHTWLEGKHERWLRDTEPAPADASGTRPDS